MSIGQVLMVHGNIVGSWTVYLPDGSILSTPNTTTMGLQEALNYAWSNAYPLTVLGGGIIKASGQTPPIPLSEIICTTPIQVPTSWINCAHFYGVNLLYDVAHGADPSKDFFTFDSGDGTDWNMHGSQVIYPGNASAFRWNPQNDNGESFIGTTSSSFKFGTIAIVNPATQQPESTHGTALHFSLPYIYGPFENGNGLISGCAFEVKETNGGVNVVVIDTPQAGSTWTRNKLSIQFPHSYGQNYLVDNSGDTLQNIYEFPGTLARTAFAINSSPYIWVNNTGRVASVWISGPAIEGTYLSIDGTNWDFGGTGTYNQYYTILPGMHFKVVSGAFPTYFFAYY